MRFFNTEGPVNRTKHYCLPSLARIALNEEAHLLIFDRTPGKPSA
jgi:hypothetical protein